MLSHHLCFAAFAWLLTIASGMPTRAAVLVVEADGSGAYPTIQSAVDAAALGDTIELGDGKFDGPGNTEITIPLGPLTMRSRSGDPEACYLRISESQVGLSVESQHQLSVDRIGFQGGTGLVVAQGWVYAAGLRFESSSIQAIDELLLRDSWVDSGITTGWGAQMTVEDCVTGPISAGSSSHATITRSQIVGGISGYAQFFVSECLILHGGISGAEYADISRTAFIDPGRAVWVPHEESLVMNGCTIIGADEDAIVVAGEPGVVSIAGTIVYGSGGRAVKVSPGAMPWVSISCCNFIANAGGDWTGPLAPLLGTHGNISANPLFCDLENDDLSLAADSPCLPENSSCGGMGAFFEAGCDEPSPIVIPLQPDGSGFLPTIQAALDFAAPHDTISLADGVYSGPWNRDLTYGGKLLVLRSASGNPAACVIDAQGTAPQSHRGFIFTSGETANSILEGVTITGGAAFGEGVARFGGGLYGAEASPTIRNCIFEGNVAQRNGGAINLFHSEAVIEDCIIRGNEAALGGGISSASSSLTIRGTQVTGNMATESGGGIRYFAQFTDAPRMESVTVSGNEAPVGGGVECLEAVKLSIARSIVWDNCANAGAELRLTGAGSTATLTCSDIDTSGVGIEHPAALFIFEGRDNISLNPKFCRPIECAGTPTIEGEFTLDGSSPCSPAHSPDGCGLIGTHPVDCDATSGTPPGISSVKDENLLTLRSDPNPFSRSTTLRLRLPFPGQVDVSIYDIGGKRVRSLGPLTLEAGDQSLEWNGSDDRGHRVPNGVYLCRMRIGSQTASTTLIAVAG